MDGTQTKSNFLQDTPLFRGMYPAEVSHVCKLLQFGARTYHEGDILIYQGQEIQSFGLVAAGVVRVSMTDTVGNELTMADIGQDGTFAESHAYIGTPESPICARALSNCSVFWFQAFLLRDADFRSDVAFARFSVNFMRVLAERNLAFNDRIQVLAKKTLRDKLLTYFSQQMTVQKSLDIQIDMDRNTLACYLGVDRSSLSRELARMANDGLIEYRKNRFVIK